MRFLGVKPTAKLMAPTDSGCHSIQAPDVAIYRKTVLVLCWFKMNVFRVQSESNPEDSCIYAHEEIMVHPRLQCMANSTISCLFRGRLAGSESACCCADMRGVVRMSMASSESRRHRDLKPVGLADHCTGQSDGASSGSRKLGPQEDPIRFITCFPWVDLVRISRQGDANFCWGGEPCRPLCRITSHTLSLDPPPG